MKKEYIKIKHIPCILWGNESNKLYIFVHGKESNKEDAQYFAKTASEKGYQTLSFDLAKHGDRKEEDTKCDLFNSQIDLKIIADYAFKLHSNISLFACSLGAFFSLHSYNQYNFQKCLFQSPIIDMKYLIEQMFLWFNINEEELKNKINIETPIETLNYNYYKYVKTNPISNWKVKTSIIFAEKDNLQTKEIMLDFTKKFQANLEISSNSEHSFLNIEDQKIIKKWLKKNI